MQDALTALPLVAAPFTRAPLGHLCAAVADVVRRHDGADESSVGFETHGSALTDTAGGRLRRGLAVVLEISKPRSAQLVSGAVVV